MRPATRLALVRHGRTDWNRRGLLQGSSDIPLDDAGRQQARDAARMLARDEWDSVVTSPLARAVGTGRIIAAHLGIGVAGTVADLAERSYGAAEGLSRAEADALWPGEDSPGSESLGSVSSRGRRALDTIVSMHPGCRIVVVAHGALLRAVLGDLTDVPVPRIVNGAISEVEWTGRWHVRSVNRITSHAAP